MGNPVKKPVLHLSRKQQLSARAQGMKENPELTPIAVPGKSETPPTLKDEMKRFIQGEIAKQATDNVNGTFTEEDDFEEDGQEGDILTPYTVTDLTPEEGTAYELEPSAETEPESTIVENTSQVAPEEPPQNESEPVEKSYTIEEIREAFKLKVPGP